MKRVSVSEAKNKLSALLHEAQLGGSFVICDRGKPIAKLEAIEQNDVGTEDWLERLHAKGILRPPAKQHPSADEILKHPPVKLKRKMDVVQLIRDDRDAGW